MAPYHVGPAGARAGTLPDVTTTDTAVATWLEREGAHHDVVEWARAFGDDWEAAWTGCPRGDWLLGIAARRAIDRRAIVEAACACARLGLDHVPDDEGRPRAAIEAAEAWARGEDDPAARADARAAVAAAVDGAPDPAVAAAATAALAALCAVDDPAEAAAAPASVVQAAVLDVGDCAMMSAMSYAQRTCADRVREAIPRLVAEPERGS